MIQMYTPDNVRDINEERAFEVFKAMIDPLKISLNNYYDNLYSSADLGKIIYSYPISPITKIWYNEGIIQAYPSWHSLYQNLQTMDLLVEFIDALYKDAKLDVTIYAPLVISLTADVDANIEVWWNRDGRYNLDVVSGDIKDFEDSKEAQIFVRDCDNDEDAVGIVFNFMPIDISESALSNILRDVIYPGLYYTTSVIK